MRMKDTIGLEEAQDKLTQGKQFIMCNSNDLPEYVRGATCIFQRFNECEFQGTHDKECQYCKGAISFSVQGQRVVDLTNTEVFEKACLSHSYGAGGYINKSGIISIEEDFLSEEDMEL